MRPTFPFSYLNILFGWERDTWGVEPNIETSIFLMFSSLRGPGEIEDEACVKLVKEMSNKFEVRNIFPVHLYFIVSPRTPTSDGCFFRRKDYFFN